jgi:hypothetical protein
MQKEAKCMALSWDCGYLFENYLSCVKKIAYVNVEIPLEPHYITICTMHNLFHEERISNQKSECV